MSTFDDFSPLQQFQFVDKYSRWNYDLQRRETWDEAVTRSVEFLVELAGEVNLEEHAKEIESAMSNMAAFPSMRLFAMAGEAGRRNNATLYNCAYTSVCTLQTFGEILSILMSGTGAGYSVEYKYISQLPKVVKKIGRTIFYWTVDDTAQGWVDALNEGLQQWWQGNDVVFDYSELRPAGAPLIVKGGTASGGEPLKRLLTNIRDIIFNGAGRQLTTLEVHDIVCWIADCVVSGGVRRSALLTLFDPDDNDMKTCKTGEWWVDNPQRANANISANMLADDDASELIRLQHENKSGEPGIMSREAAQQWVTQNDSTRDPNYEFGVNPCGEIILRPKQFCNLTVAVIRPDDTPNDVAKKIKVATWIGTIQSTATHFPGLSDEWAVNCEDERLLGVSLLGVMDAPHLMTEKNIIYWREVARSANTELAELLGINKSAAITTIKPSGNSSLLFDASPGIQARWAKYYIRRVSVSKHGRLAEFMKDQGVVLHQSPYTEDTLIAEFPVKAPPHAKTQDELTAKEQLSMWLLLKQYYTDHNVSATITYKADEIDDIIEIINGHPIYKGGVSFLEMDENTYQLAPYEQITREEYQSMVKNQPMINWDALSNYEHTDETTAASVLACSSGVCILE